MMRKKTEKAKNSNFSSSLFRGFLFALSLLFGGLNAQQQPNIQQHLHDNNSNHSKSASDPPKIVTDCSDAPTEVLKQVCLKLRQVDRKARQAPLFSVDRTVLPPAIPGSPVWQRPEPVPINSRGQVAFDPRDCMTLQCLCPFFGGRMWPDGYCHFGADNRPLAMAYRKEYRMMTEDERRRFHYAMSVMKMNGDFDRFTAEHQMVSTGVAHSGPSFLPWHREFLKRVEHTLRLIDPTVAIPYWDSVMDSYLPDPRDSIIFSPEFLGESDFSGAVVNGPFAFWRTIEGRPFITRNLGTDGMLFNEFQLNNVINDGNIVNVLAYTVPFPGCPVSPNFAALEYSHSNIHFWLGGDMRIPETSANDPVFFVHHSFVDLIWEIWRQLRQPKWSREWDWPPNLYECSNDYHFSWSPMRPYNFLSNRDGLSNSYTDQLYRYAPRPTCSSERPTCDSTYLFCDLNHGFPHCVSKIKIGGLCNGFEGLDACYMGNCIFGRCVPGSTPPPFRPVTPAIPIRQLMPVTAQPNMGRPRVPGRRNRQRSRSRSRSKARTRSRTLAAKNIVAVEPTNLSFVNCFNKNPCCEHWASMGECEKNKRYMETYCQASCNFCIPTFNMTDECADRHVSCQQWSEDGECDGRSKLLMEENCRESCNLCKYSKYTHSCLVQANFSKITSKEEFRAMKLKAILQ